LPFLVLFYFLVLRRRRAYTLRFTNLNLLSTVVGTKPGVRKHIPPVIYLLGLGILFLSFARPTAVIPVPQKQTTVMLVMDVSGSMDARDLTPNRLQAAKQAAKLLVENLPDDMRIGLVSFSGSASLRAPLTRDHEAVTRALDNLRAGGGTAIGEGLNLALDQLSTRETVTDQNGEAQRVPGIVVLLSDGESNTGMPPAQATARAANENVKVYTVGIGQRGTTATLPGTGGSRQQQQVRLDEATLRDIAKETNGQYYYAAETAELEQIYANLGNQVSWEEERTEITALVSALGTMILVVGAGLSLRWFGQLL
jgi:Ca-activated chloride channel family protein